MDETQLSPKPVRDDHTVAVMVIIATTIILLTCIAGCTASIIALAINMH